MTKKYQIGIIEGERYLLTGGELSQEWNKTFRNMAALLNFVIEDSWEKSAEGFTFVGNPFPTRVLPEDERNLIGRVSQSYQQLERTKQQAEELNRILRTNVENLEKGLAEQRKIRKDLEEKARQ